MPYYPPANITKTASNNDLYQPIGGSGGNSGVTSLRTLTGAINMTSPNNTLEITNNENNIELVVNPIDIGVGSLNALQGVINIESNDNSINVDIVGNNIDLSANINVGVSSLNTKEGALTITSSNSSVNVVTTTNNIDLTVAPASIGVQSLNGLTSAVNLTSTGSTVAITQVGQSINLETVTVAPTNPNTIEGTATFDLADKLADVTGKAIATIRAQNGLGGEVDIIANAGSGGINGGKVAITANGGQVYGEIDIVANSGVVGGVSTGGLVTITANSGLADTTTTSAIKLSAAGINSYAGAIPSIGSVAGYNFIYGTGGVNICAGLPAGALPNALGTTYIYGTTGVEIPSNLYPTNLYPYWDGNSAPSDITINGRTTIVGSAGVRLNNVKSMSMDSGAISGVSTINGSAYPPASSGVTTLNGLSSAVTLSAGTGIGLSTVGQNITINATASAPTSISQAGGSVAVGTLGEITMNTASGTGLETISIHADGGINITSENQNLVIQSNTNVVSKIEFDYTGNILMNSGDDDYININTGNGVEVYSTNGPIAINSDTNNISLGAGLTGTAYFSSLSLATNGVIDLKSSLNNITVGNVGSELLLNNNGEVSLSSLAGETVLLDNQTTKILVGYSAITPPTTGLFIDDTRLIYNGTSLLNNVSSFNNTSGAITFNTDVPLSLPAPVSNTFNLSFSPAFVTPIPLTSGSTTTFPLTDFYNYGQICLNPSGATPTFNFDTTALTTAFKCCYIKNSSPSGGSGADVNIHVNGAPINGPTGTSTLHQRTNTNNTGNSILYWNGTSLFLY